MNIIIDGHGAMADTEYNFCRTNYDHSKIFCLVREGIKADGNFSNQIIARIAQGNTNELERVYAADEISSKCTSGKMIKDMVLSSIKTKNNQPQWNNDSLFGSGRTVIINDVEMLELVGKKDCIYLRIKEYDSKKTVLLSQIIEYYNTGKHNFWWVACRVD